MADFGNLASPIGDSPSTEDKFGGLAAPVKAAALSKPEAPKEEKKPGREYSLPEEAFGAIAEPVMSMASGMIAKPAADIATLGAIPAHAAGLTKTEPKDVRKSVEDALTVTPKTRAGSSPYNP